LENIDSLAPQQKHLVFDLLNQLDFDTSDWIDSLTSDSPPASNPKYCFDWSFIRQDEKIIVLNLWHEELLESNGTIFQEHKFKEDASFATDKKRRNRALDIDKACRTAFTKGIPLRVLICKGDINHSKVHKRELDTEFWAVTAYDLVSGACIIERGTTPNLPNFIDQFDIDRSQSTPEQYDRNGVTYVRSGFVRRRVLMRANGQCEFCNKQGFITNSGNHYLESHHIIPLSEKGSDTEDNVIALCPEDHRKAHFETNTLLTKESLLSIVNKNIQKPGARSFTY